MSNSTHLYGLATARTMQAERCRSVADTIDVRRAAMIERHRPTAALHQEEVWRGRAADASRAKLQSVIGAALYSLGDDLATTCRALRDEASRLEDEAAALRRRARALAEASQPAPSRPRAGDRNRDAHVFSRA